MSIEQTRKEIFKRIDMLGAEIEMNKDENYIMECEIEELEKMLEALGDE
ncbi:MAG: hypothetical protein ACXW1D_00160 [Halobacteriota archaeon]